MPEVIEAWELAKREGKTVICKIMGPMVSVFYPYRKSGDLYIVGPDSPESIIHCCQSCDKDFPTKDFLEHIQFHNKMKRKYPNVIVDPALVQKVALDSMPSLRKRLILKMMESPDASYVTSKLAASLGYPTTFTRYSLEDLAAYGIVARESQGQGQADLWSLTVWAKAVYLSATAPLHAR